jgi:hypothetical protein
VPYAFPLRPILWPPHGLPSVIVHRLARRNRNIRFGSTYVTSCPVHRELPAMSAHFLHRIVASQTRSPSLRKVALSPSSAVSPLWLLMLPWALSYNGLPFMSVIIDEKITYAFFFPVCDPRFPVLYCTVSAIDRNRSLYAHPLLLPFPPTNCDDVQVLFPFRHERCLVCSRCLHDLSVTLIASPSAFPLRVCVR